ncbi:MAG: hypothetical protein H6540_00345 [Bacteroidales bacterium]|nr:hypothetical protein [Bacteroidales bacterium]
MNISNKFDPYYEGSLSGADRKEFEEQLEKNPDLAQSYEEYAQVQKVIKTELYSPILGDKHDPLLENLSNSQKLEIEQDYSKYSDKKIRSFAGTDEGRELIGSTADNYAETLTEDEAEFRSKLSRIINSGIGIKRMNQKTIFWIAASLMLVILSSYYIFEKYGILNLKSSPQDIYLSYFNPSSDPVIINQHFENQQLKAELSIRKRGSLNTNNILNNQMKVGKSDYELSLLHLGIIELERRNIPEAQNCFTLLKQIKDSKQYHSACFYLALSYLAAGNEKLAYPLLINLKNSPNPYTASARKILRALKKG